MTDAREIIVGACFDRETAGLQAIDILDAVEAAGFRILGPDEVEAIERLKARADSWSLNSDSARVSVRLGDLRALGRKA